MRVILDKCIKVICTIYKNNTAAVEIGSKVSSSLIVESRVNQWCDAFCSKVPREVHGRSTGEDHGRH